MKNVIRRFPENIHPEENEAVKAAITETPPEDFAIIESVLIKKTTSVREAAFQNYLSYTQTVERFKRFYRIVADNLDLPTDETKAPAAKYREDWHTYLRAILARYPENRHKAETVAIKAALDASDETTREYINRAYIQRTEQAKIVAYELNIHPVTMDHRKTAFFYHLAENLNLPTD